MTGGDEGGNDRLVIRLPISLVNVETIHSPDGWLQLLSAEPGETLAAFWDRAIVRNPFLQSIIARTSRQPVPSGAVACPAALTLAWWEKTWPDKMFSPYFDAHNYHRDRVYWRLVVELCERLRVGDLVMKGHRTGVSAYPLEVVEQGLFRNPFMVLRPRVPQGGWFRPEQWHGSEPPQSLPSYHELTLWPAKAAAETKRAKTPRQLTADALVSLHGEGVDLRSPASVTVLHTLAEAKSGVKVSRATLERALADARIFLQSHQTPSRGS